jgi:hypothetical protein
LGLDGKRQGKTKRDQRAAADKVHDFPSFVAGGTLSPHGSARPRILYASHGAVGARFVKADKAPHRSPRLNYFGNKNSFCLATDGRFIRAISLAE